MFGRNNRRSVRVVGSMGGELRSKTPWWPRPILRRNKAKHLCASWFGYIISPSPTCSRSHLLICCTLTLASLDRSELGRDTPKNKGKTRILIPFGYLFQLHFVVLLGKKCSFIWKRSNEKWGWTRGANGEPVVGCVKWIGHDWGHQPGGKFLLVFLLPTWAHRVTTC